MTRVIPGPRARNETDRAAVPPGSERGSKRISWATSVGSCIVSHEGCVARTITYSIAGAIPPTV